MFLSNQQKVLAKTVFGIYTLLLVWLILFKFSVDFSDLPQIRNVNLVPFGESVIINGNISLSEIVYNILVFIPLGVYVNVFWNEWSFGKKILPILGCSLGFEVIQFVFGIGASDITDVIGNTLGGIAGLFLFMLIKRLFRAKTVTAINTVGLTVESIALVFIAILTIANL